MSCSIEKYIKRFLKYYYFCRWLPAPFPVDNEWNVHHRRSFSGDEIEEIQVIFLSYFHVKAISLFFSVLRPRTGRFLTTKVRKQTKENLYENAFL
jgi:hypothetical protein